MTSQPPRKHLIKYTLPVLLPQPTIDSLVKDTPSYKRIKNDCSDSDYKLTNTYNIIRNKLILKTKLGSAYMPRLAENLSANNKQNLSINKQNLFDDKNSKKNIEKQKLKILETKNVLDGQLKKIKEEIEKKLQIIDNAEDKESTLVVKCKEVCILLKMREGYMLKMYQELSDIDIKLEEAWDFVKRAVHLINV